METLKIVHVFLILAGAIIMLIGIFRSNDIMDYLPFVPEKHQEHIKWKLVLHQGLMAFFLLGYIIVLTSFVFHYHILSETIVSLIFFFGAVFVFIGISVQSRLLAGVKTTLKGILPICCTCKKIRPADRDPSDQKAWKHIEEFICQQSEVNFSHGLCPACYEAEMEKIDFGSGQTPLKDGETVY